MNGASRRPASGLGKLLVLAALVLGSLSLPPADVLASHSSRPAASLFTNRECKYSLTGWLTKPYTRSQARDHSFSVHAEGYQWGGGCWNDNNKDDAPGDETQDWTTKGEGPDCGGLVGKVWGLGHQCVLNGTCNGAYFFYTLFFGGLMGSKGAVSDFHYWGMLTDIAPPGDSPTGVTASSYKVSSSLGWTGISKTDAQLMDAVASGTHVFLMFYRGGSRNQDMIIEAAREAEGSHLIVSDKRYESHFNGASRRVNWPG